MFDFIICACTTPGRKVPGVLIALFLISLAPIGAVSAAGLQPNAPWPMFHRNTGHAGQSWSPIPMTGAIAWSVAVSDTVEFSSPAVAADGTIYIGDQGKELWAFAPDGTPKWNYHTDGNIRYSSPAIGADGTIFIGSADGRLYAIRPDGTLRWAALTGGAVKTSPAIGEDGTVYVGSDDGKLWAFRDNGMVRWSFMAADTVRSSPAVGPDSTIYFGCNDGTIYAVRPDGSLKWSGFTGGPIKGGPAVGRNGAVCFGSADGFLYSVWPNGQLNWATFTGQNLRSTPAIGIFGKIYLGVDTQILAYDDDGVDAWDFDTGARVYSSPAVYTAPDSSEIVLCGSDNGRLYAVNYGALVWSALLSGPVRSSPAIGATGHVYVGSLNARLYAIGPPTTSVEEGGGRGTRGPRLIIGPNPVATGRSVSIALEGVAPGQSGTLRLHDVAGRLRWEMPLAAGGSVLVSPLAADGRAIPSGVYWVRWSDGATDARSRLVILR